MTSSTSGSQTNPDLMIAWTGAMTSNRNFGAWVIESPSPSQLRIFTEANFPLSQACFAPPELMEKAGAEHYFNRRACAAITRWMWADPPPLLIGLAREQGVGVWVLRNPTAEQLQVFREANFDINERRFAANPDLMAQAGATRHPDINHVPEVLSLLFAPKLDKERVGDNIFGWPMTGGVWALLNPTWEQIEELKRGGYDFGVYDGEDRWHGLLESVGAKWFADPEEVRHEVDKVSPGSRPQPPGTRGGAAL